MHNDPYTEPTDETRSAGVILIIAVAAALLIACSVIWLVMR